jgi:hypothetical protein
LGAERNTRAESRRIYLMSPNRIARALTCWVCALLIFSTSAAHAAKIEKVLPFTGLDQVRLRMDLAPDGTTGDVEFTGRIVPASPDNAPALWEGSLGKAKLKANAGATRVEHRVKGLKPKLWSPGSPNLYKLIVDAKQGDKTLDTTTVRFGFRTMEAKAGHVYLNGKPVFLRGIAINPPGRGVPKDVGTSRKFAEDYVRFMRAHNVNIIRLEPESDVWFDVCDEQGMMIYQGVYGGPPGDREGGSAKGAAPNKNKVPILDSALTEYRKLFDNYLAHPSIVVYVLSNELPYDGKRGAMWHEFLTKAHAALKKDYPVPFIGNAGYGQGREGDINDVHRYWGWYYNSLLTYYNLRDPLLFGDPNKTKSQPLTFSECVGSFTGPSGAFNQIFRKQLGASLEWTGHAEDQVGEAQDYQAFIFKHAAESFRTMREINPRLSGLMPFTILFRNWVGIQSFDQMSHNANADQMKLSYNPVLLSWEQWTPNVYAGTTVKAFAHVVNDAEDFSDLSGATLAWELLDAKGKAIPGNAGAAQLDTVKYYGTAKIPVEIKLNAALPTGKYTVHGVINKGADKVAENTFDLFVAGDEWKRGGAKPGGETVQLYDPAGKTAAAFKQLELPFKPADLKKLDQNTPLVIAEGAWDAPLKSAAPQLKAAVSKGMRVLVLAQSPKKFDPSWLPSTIVFPTQSKNDPVYEKRTRPTIDGMHINPERPWHAALAGVDRDQLKLWSDYTGWDQSKSGFPAIYPVTAGFRLTDPKDLAHTAIIANYDRGLEAIAIAEMFDGKGSVTMTGLEIVPRVGKDPVADRVLKNLIAAVTSSDAHEVHPLVDKPIKWGDYPSERGVVVEPIGGLVVNCRWQKPPTAPADVKPLPDNEGAWNTRPGDGFVPHGRRVFGPWSYTNATGIRELNDKGQVAGAEPPADAADAGAVNNERDDADNAPQKKSKASPIGHGEFWARVPSDRKTCVTTVENPTDKPGKLEMSVSGGKLASVEVPPHQTAKVTCEIPDAASKDSVNVRFTADKSLVLLETAFE